MDQDAVFGQSQPLNEVGILSRVRPAGQKARSGMREKNGSFKGPEMKAG
jgi:hypothetical protein